MPLLTGARFATFLMAASSVRTPQRSTFVQIVSCFAVGFLINQAFATDAKKEARITQIIRDVKVLPSDAALRPAVVNDEVKENTAVRTGLESRSELTFADLTITRLGANTIFSFNKAGHSVQLDSGSILLRVPKDSGGGFIRTNVVTVAVTGTTVIFEASRAGRSKLIVLEGGAGVVLKKRPGHSQSVRAGQMLDVPAGATALPKPANVDLSQIMATHPLITDFGPLPSRDLIQAVIKQAVDPKSTKDQAPQKQADKEQAAEERADKDQATEEQAIRDQARKDRAAQDRADKEQADKDQATHEEAEKEQAYRERAAQKQADNERADREQAAQKQADNERADRERAAQKQSEKEEADTEQTPHKQPDRERPPS